MANMLGRLGVVLGLDSAEFVMGIDRAGKKLEQFAAKADEYGKYAATAFTVLSIAAIKYADDIADVSSAWVLAVLTVPVYVVGNADCLGNPASLLAYKL